MWMILGGFGGLLELEELDLDWGGDCGSDGVVTHTKEFIVTHSIS